MAGAFQQKHEAALRAQSGAPCLERLWFLPNRQNRSISLFQPHFRTQNRFHTFAGNALLPGA
jgi:hypothetical protein